MKRRASKRTAGILLASVVVLLMSTLLASSRNIAGVERAVFDTIYGLPLSLRPFVLAITQTGSTWMVVVLTCSLFAMRRRLLALQVLTVGLSTFVVTELMKNVIGRPRPFELLVDVISRERFVAGMGFPSGHTAVTTAIAIVLASVLPKAWRPWLAMWAISVGISRIYLGVHAPLDVVGGAAVGVIVAELFWLAWPKMKKALK